MFTDIEQLINDFSALLSEVSLLKGLLFLVFFLVVWFFPALVAFFLNRKHFGKILAANVPAVLSWVAWFALLAWAVTGKMRGKKGEASGPAEEEGARPVVSGSLNESS
ncbi:superinfection immunity protein [Microbulbifer sp. A4B17]|uniref:superinfection immunity protein n=1 Tax=Microbulbifer sp. A4B17 TaxID=359370 RepID=UPI00192D2058|nr:superinfection immunity protein [Microbulbifer sp. A4B17]